MQDDRSQAPDPAPPDPPRRWGFFVLLNVVAVVLALVLTQLAWSAPGFEGVLDRLARWFLARPMLAAFLAFSPVLASMPIGWVYLRRARRARTLPVPEVSDRPSAG